MKFAIAIEAGSDTTAYGVTVPDLPGCFSAGDTIEEAFDNAVEAIETYVETLAEDGKAIPVTRPLSEWQKDKEYKGWTWGIVDVPVEKLFGPAEKINITVPSLLLKRIDQYASRKGKTRSGFLSDAAVMIMRGAEHAPMSDIVRTGVVAVDLRGVGARAKVSSRHSVQEAQPRKRPKSRESARTR